MAGRSSKTSSGAEPRKPARTLAVSYWAAALYLFLLVLLAVFLWSTRRERSSHVRVPDLVDFRQDVASLANLTGSPIIAGNRATVLQDGDEFFPALLGDIVRARHNIHIETYVWWRGRICRRLAALLADKARAGVEVRLTLDAIGSNQGENALFRSMQAACRELDLAGWRRRGPWHRLVDRVSYLLNEEL